MPVVPFRKDAINNLLKEIAKRERGLAMYLFTKDIAWAKKTITDTNELN